MTKRAGTPRRAVTDDRARLRELAGAVEQELAGGRPPAAVVRALLTLGFDKPTAQRFVRTVACAMEHPCAPPLLRSSARQRLRPRLAVSGLLIAAGLFVLFASASARLYGFAFWAALFVTTLGALDAAAAVLARRRAA
jgi:hypothetical protein